ncbi:CBS domain-containing protein [Nitriliruptoraceae bacterium ZYF776]|nr:CBS domain-containing protein [Profundirhabdus halotolerans]
MGSVIAEVLETKGREVHTTRPGTRLADAVAALDQHGVGALVVVGQARDVVGVLSERDVVRRLAAEGPAVLDRPVEDVMTAPVTTCAPEATIEELMVVMTQRRIRHLPVVVDGELVGIVSIGDVVKRRLDELRATADHLADYVAGSY